MSSVTQEMGGGKPFYEAKRVPLFATDGLYDLWYFQAEPQAKAFSARIPGSYVIESSRGQIWRVTAKAVPQ